MIIRQKAVALPCNRLLSVSADLKNCFADEPKKAAGADVLYAPALKTFEEVRLVTEPVNVLAPFLEAILNF